MSSMNLFQTNGLIGLASRKSFLEICHVDNRESDSHFSSHSDDVSLQEVSFIEFERIFFKYESH